MWGVIHVVAFNLVAFLLLFAHGRAVFADPGLVPLPDVAVDFSEARTLFSKNNVSRRRCVVVVLLLLPLLLLLPD